MLNLHVLTYVLFQVSPTATTVKEGTEAQKAEGMSASKKVWLAVNLHNTPIMITILVALMMATF